MLQNAHDMIKLKTDWKYITAVIINNANLYKNEIIFVSVSQIK